MLEINPLVLMQEVRKLFLELWSIHSWSLITSWICECKIPRFQAIRRHRRHSSSTTWNPHGVESRVGCNGITDCTTRHLLMEYEACKVHKDEAIIRREWSFLNKCKEKAWFVTDSLLFWSWLLLLVYKCLKRADASLHMMVFVLAVIIGDPSFLFRMAHLLSKPSNHDTHGSFYCADCCSIYRPIFSYDSGRQEGLHWS